MEPLWGHARPSPLVVPHHDPPVVTPSAHQGFSDQVPRPSDEDGVASVADDDATWVEVAVGDACAWGLGMVWGEGREGREGAEEEGIWVGKKRSELERSSYIRKRTREVVL